MLANSRTVTGSGRVPRTDAITPSVKVACACCGKRVHRKSSTASRTRPNCKWLEGKRQALETLSLSVKLSCTHDVDEDCSKGLQRCTFRALAPRAVAPRASGPRAKGFAHIQDAIAADLRMHRQDDGVIASVRQVPRAGRSKLISDYSSVDQTCDASMSPHCMTELGMHTVDWEPQKKHNQEQVPSGRTWYGIRFSRLMIPTDADTCMATAAMFLFRKTGTTELMHKNCISIGCAVVSTLLSPPFLCQLGKHVYLALRVAKLQYCCTSPPLLQ
jgi:hypothetical protein